MVGDLAPKLLDPAPLNGVRWVLEEPEACWSLVRLPSPRR
ncbi:Uncharacterized protein PPKH_2716 [Pseudomonas putida]|nr:Uncharacterized protein PPKH_2716 [Pseudomonas putida]